MESGVRTWCLESGLWDLVSGIRTWFLESALGSLQSRLTRLESELGVFSLDMWRAGLDFRIGSLNSCLRAHSWESTVPLSRGSGLEVWT